MMLIRKAINPGLRILAHEAEAEGFKSFAYEYRFAPPRKFRFDLAFPELRVALERDGGTWQKSRHTSGKGFRDDARKLNLAAAAGWLVVRATADMMQDGTALADLLAVLKFRADYVQQLPPLSPAGRTKPPPKEGRPLS
jgi:very-short-patch-repair endonuclease